MAVGYSGIESPLLRVSDSKRTFRLPRKSVLRLMEKQEILLKANQGRFWHLGDVLPSVQVLWNSRDFG